MEGEHLILRHIITILKWEISKILSSWQKTLAIFLIPAAVMVGAVSLFPKLLNYLSTGSFGSARVIVLNAPDSFRQYDGKMEDLFSYQYMTYEEYEMTSGYQITGSDYGMVKNGDILVEFFTMSGVPFEEAVQKKYTDLYENKVNNEPDAYISVGYDADKVTSYSKAMQIQNDVCSAYLSYLEEKYCSQYDTYNEGSFTVDDFNPVTMILDHRAEANTQASRVIPGIMMVLMYYCVYSLTLDMIAMEKNRGFLSKLVMTPVPPSKLLAGKALAINILVTGSSLVTFFFLFLSSWLNRSNDVGSLLPFGLLLMPDQLIYLIISIPACVLILTAFCFLVALTLDKFEDTTANLQMVLLLLVIGFFIRMFVYWSPIGLEYAVPVHNTIVLIRDILMSEVSLFSVIFVIAENLVLGLIIMRKCSIKLAGGQNDRSNQRKKKIFR